METLLILKDENLLNDEVEETILYEISFSYDKLERNKRIKYILMQGEFFEKKGSYQDAEEFYEIGVNEFKNSATLYLKLGQIQYQTKKYEKSWENITRSNFLDKFNPNVWIYLLLLSNVMNR